ncbi:hypothetical protein SAMN05421772_1213 [Paracoccus saliphilus]|uniref:Uncharacterized protein n=1 Tax=Paracoccus saliphilus TaxID=405559 RepID=A0AA46A7D5_9RHOB|nr:hypothetical protein SAMN05421772_1213 [Paracoccus saliphilus]
MNIESSYNQSRTTSSQSVDRGKLLVESHLLRQAAFQYASIAFFRLILRAFLLLAGHRWKWRKTR